MADENATPPAPASDAPPVSPTGAPILSPAIAKWAAPICLIAGMIVMEGPELGLVLPAAVLPWVKMVWVVGTALGIISPGQRKKS